MKIFTSILIVSVVLNTSFSFAQPGTLDSTFGRDGKVTTAFSEQSEAYSVALQADGKIILAGFSGKYPDYNFALTRYKSNGRIDKTFGVDGKAITDFGGYDKAYSVAIQPDGRIVAAGYTLVGHDDDFALARYKQNGDLDSAFGVNGKVTTDFENANDFGSAVAIQTDRKIVVAGYSAGSFLLARYKPNGELDNAFGVKGRAAVDVGDSYSQSHSVAVQADGKIVIVGEAKGDFVLVRYNQDGKLDSAFGLNGKVTTDFGNPDAGNSIAIQADGRMVVAGFTYSALNHNDFALARYKPNGKLDSSFGLDGKVTTNFGPSAVSRSVAIQQDGRIVAAGYNSLDFAVARYEPNGHIDKVFGVNGKVTTDFGNSPEQGQSVAIQADGKILVGGISGKMFAIARYHGDNNFSVNSSGNNFSRIKNLNSNTSAIHLSPNPVKRILRIEGLSTLSKTISIFDATGKLLQQVTTANSSYFFNVRQLAAGIYFLRIDEGEKTTTLKFIKE